MELIKEAEAARRLNISIQTLRNWRCQHKNVPYVKIGSRSIRYIGEQIDKWAQSRVIDPETQYAGR